MKKIKVLHISETFAAGVYTYIKDISLFVKNHDYIDNYVIYSGKRKDTYKENFSKDFPNTTTLIEVEMNREISPMNDLKSLLKLIKYIRKIKPHVIHLHSSKAGVIGRIAAKFYPKSKLYYTPHGYSFLREDISNNKKKIFKLIEKYTTFFFGGITIACGDTEFEYAKKLGKSLLVRNGVGIDDLLKTNTLKKNNFKEFKIGTVGRITYQKNPALFNDIAEKMPHINFVWIGDGELKRMLVSSNIEITGWLSREKTLELINSFDIYIQTSLWEGLPFTILEAMTLEKPIIANNVIGNKDAVKHNYNGFLCNNLGSFTNAISTILKNDKLRKKMGANSLSRIKENFNRNENLKKLIKIYEN